MMYISALPQCIAIAPYIRYVWKNQSYWATLFHSLYLYNMSGRSDLSYHLYLSYLDSKNRTTHTYLFDRTTKRTTNARTEPRYDIYNVSFWFGTKARTYAFTFNLNHFSILYIYLLCVTNFFIVRNWTAHLSFNLYSLYIIRSAFLLYDDSRLVYEKRERGKFILSCLCTLAKCEPVKTFCL